VSRELLRKARKELGFTVKQFCKFAGLHPTILSRLETGKDGPYLKGHYTTRRFNKHAMHLCSVLNLFPEDVWPDQFPKIDQFDETEHVDESTCMEDQYARHELPIEIQAQLKNLTPDESLVLALFYNLPIVHEDDKKYGYLRKEIQDYNGNSIATALYPRLNITRAMLQQMRWKALHKLRHPTRSDFLRPFDDLLYSNSVRVRLV